MNRRGFLQFGAVVASTSTLLGPRLVLAKEVDAFQATTLEGVFGALSLPIPEISDQIKIEAPKVAENGAKVPIRIISSIPGTTEIIAIVSGNPKPLAAHYRFGSKANAAVSSRVKMRKTSEVIAVAKVRDNYFMAKTEVKVTLSGCGG